jgi:L-asparaginase
VPPEGRAHAGVLPTVSGEELVAAVPEVNEAAEVSVTTFRQLPSCELAVADLLALATAIEEQFRDGVDGVVVTQGTDTLEETAFALDLLVADHRPVVVTGAMRPPGAPGADGAANLLAAVGVASSEACYGVGCLVVMNDEIHAARYVRKAHTQSLGAFRSDPLGPIGWISEGQPRLALRPVGRCLLGRRPRAAESAVALVAIGPADEGPVLAAVGEGGYRGAVLETLGGGHVSAATAVLVGDLSRLIPVVFTSRTGAGEVLRRTYAFPGSETDLLERGAICAGALDGPKARLLLRLLLGAGASTAEVRAAFETLTKPVAATLRLLAKDPADATPA